MEVNVKSRRRVRLESVVFVLLFLAFIGLLAWLSTRFDYQADWTSNHRNTLSAASRKLLDRLKAPIEVTAYASNDPSLRQRIEDVVDRYRRYRKDIRLTWINTATHPAEVRKADISRDGELIITYQGRREKVEFPPSEEKLTNALQRVARGGDEWLVFITGHGERDPTGRANFDLGDWGRQLRSKGLKIRALNLADQATIPDNTSVVVIAGPQVKLLPGEVTLLQRYVKRGGNLLWLADPGPLFGLQPLAQQLGVTFGPGTIVDTTAQLVGINDPSFAVITDYGDQPITRDFSLVTVFPQARPLTVKARDDWHSTVLLRTSSRSWSETGKLQGTIEFNPGRDLKGPLTIGDALTRRPGGGREPVKTMAGKAPAAGGEGRQQRVVVIGDGDFLANSYLGNGGNLELGMNIINWLTSDDAFINIPVKSAPDIQLSLSQKQASLLAIFFLVLVPGGMLAGGGWIWWKRRR